MPAYLIKHKRGPSGDAIIEDPDLTLAFSGDWAIFSDADGPTLALTTDQAASIQRIDPDDTGQEQDDTTAKGPAPQE